MAEYLYGAALYPYYLKAKSLERDEKYDFVKFLIDHNFYQAEGEEYKKYKDQLPDFVEWTPVDVGPASALIEKYGSDFSKTITLIFLARKVNTILLTLNIIVAYFIVKVAFSVPVALITVLFFGFNNLVLSNSLAAHSEALFLLLFNLAILLLILIFGRGRKSKKTLFLFAVFTALCTQTKLNGAMLLIFFNISIFFEGLSNFMRKNFLRRDWLIFL